MLMPVHDATAHRPGTLKFAPLFFSILFILHCNWKGTVAMGLFDRLFCSLLPLLMGWLKSLVLFFFVSIAAEFGFYAAY